MAGGATGPDSRPPGAQRGATGTEGQAPAGRAAAAGPTASAASEAVEQRLLGVAECKGVRHGLQLAIVVKVAAVIHALDGGPAGVGGHRVVANELAIECTPCMHLLGCTAAVG